MLQYGKIENGALTVYDGGSARYNGRVYVNLGYDTLKKLGYKPIIDAATPDEKEGYYIVRTLSEDADNVYRGHELAELPEDEDYGNNENEGVI